MMRKGKMIVVSAPSGSGKTTIVQAMLASGLNLEFSVSACSRAPRNNEKHGKDYYFLSVVDFRKKIEEDAFVEWEEVYPGNYYGTLKTEVERIWNKGNHVMFDVDVIGGLNIKKQYPEKCLALFVRPPSVAELEKRLRGRSTDSEETIKKRLAKAEYELSFARQFDQVIINDLLEEAIQETRKIITDFIQKP
jgi:guanylate kinase